MDELCSQSEQPSPPSSIARQPAQRISPVLQSQPLQNLTIFTSSATVQGNSTCSAAVQGVLPSSAWDGGDVVKRKMVVVLHVLQ